MKKTIEFLKNKGVIEELQNIFNAHKPPLGTPEKVITEAIHEKLSFECDKDEGFEDAFFDAVFEDIALHVRKELNIEFVEEKEFLSRLLPKELVDLIEKSNAGVQVHVVCLSGDKKGQGEE